MNRGFFTIDFTEGDQSTYKGLELHVRIAGKPEERITFNTGDPVVDWWDYLLKVTDYELDILTQSSSVDHFFMDGNTYYEAYLDFKEKQFVSPEEAYEGFSIRTGVIEVINKTGWTYDQWHLHLYDQGRHKKR